MSEVKNTPTPWTTSPCPNGGAILHRGGEEVWRHPQGMLQIVPAEDAEFIALAVNCHHEMLAVLIDLDARLRECGALHTAEDAYDSFYQEMVAAVIAKAEGRAP